jgi:hypothetical protein
MRVYAPFALCILGLVATAPAVARQRSPFETGIRLFEGAFDPRRNFAGDIEPSSMDEMILTVAASGRDNYAPAYSLAIAHLCEPIQGGCQPHYVARVLRVSADRDEWTSRGLALVNRVDRTRRVEDAEAALEDSDLQWLEADAATCEGVIAAIDAVRLADWRADLPASLTPQGEGDIILHPAMIRVELWGAYVRTRYQGWLHGNGVPAAAIQLMERLEPCWRPSRTPRPWERRVPGRPRPLP